MSLSVPSLRLALAPTARQAFHSAPLAARVNAPSTSLLLRSSFHSGPPPRPAVIPIDARAQQQWKRQQRQQQQQEENDRKVGGWAALIAGGLVAGTAATQIRRSRVHCDLDTTPPVTSSAATPQPESIVNVYDLSFGAACGLCAGIFIKKGLKLIAFFLGGGFVLLQYLSSQRLASVDWSKMSSRYNNIIDRAAGSPPDAPGQVKGWNQSRAARIWNRFVHFLTANFQERATLLAGLALGLRLG